MTVFDVFLLLLLSKKDFLFQAFKDFVFLNTTYDTNLDIFRYQKRKEKENVMKHNESINRVNNL